MDGYNWAHRIRRRKLAASVAAGLWACRFCGEPIMAGEPWDLGHDDDRRESWPEHRRCNRATAARRLRHSRAW